MAFRAARGAALSRLVPAEAIPCFAHSLCDIVLPGGAAVDVPSRDAAAAVLAASRLTRTRWSVSATHLPPSLGLGAAPDPARENPVLVAATGAARTAVRPIATSLRRAHGGVKGSEKETRNTDKGDVYVSYGARLRSKGAEH